MGMVGGGRGAFIGGVEDLMLDPSRVYASYQDMATAEAALPADQRIDFVSIVARNDLHYAVAKAFLEAGINVICEKPLAFSLEQGKQLAEVVKASGKVFALTHNYTGYPMVKEAKAIVADGKLGRILKVVAEYPQGYASSAFHDADEGAISNWRMDPSVS